MRFKRDEEGKLELDEKGDPVAVSESGDVIPLDKVVSLAKHQRIAAERDEWKAQAEEMSKSIAELGKAAGDAEALKARVDELTAQTAADKADFEARIEAASREHALDTALLGAGVPGPRLKAAKALVDAETDAAALDLETFRRENPWLFGDGPALDTAAAAKDAAEGPDAVRMAELRQAAGLPDKPMK